MSRRRIVFTPSGKRGEFDDGVAVLDAARKLGVDLDSVCGGRGICGRCQIEIAEGEFAKHAIVSSGGHVTPWSAVEQRYAEKRGALASGRRLGCQTKLSGDLVINVPADSQAHRSTRQAELGRRSDGWRPVQGPRPVFAMHRSRPTPDQPTRSSQEPQGRHPLPPQAFSSDYSVM